MPRVSEPLLLRTAVGVDHVNLGSAVNRQSSSLLEYDLRTVGRPVGRLIKYRCRAVECQSSWHRAIGVHHVDLAIPRNRLLLKGDLLAVRRPGRPEVPDV